MSRLGTLATFSRSIGLRQVVRLPEVAILTDPEGNTLVISSSHVAGPV